MWRIVLDEHQPGTYSDIVERWSFASLFEAHVVLDALDEARPDSE